MNEKLHLYAINWYNNMVLSESKTNNLMDIGVKKFIKEKCTDIKKEHRVIIIIFWMQIIVEAKNVKDPLIHDIHAYNI